MSSEALPQFKYHPSPIDTGSVEPSAAACVCCKRVRGYVYSGPVYSPAEQIDDICPWCIADGSAHHKLEAEFVDRAGVGDYGSWPHVPDAVADEVAYRTPGFEGWQQERWFTCCGDAAAFLGRAGYRELCAFGPAAIEAVRVELGYSGQDWNDYLRALDKDGQPTAYVFRCLHCGKVGAYSDFT